MLSMPKAMPRTIHHHEHDDPQFPPKSIQISIFCNRECGRALVVILVINRSQITKNATLGLEGTFLFSFFYLFKLYVVKHMIGYFWMGRDESKRQGLNLSGSWQQDHSATYNTPSRI